MMILLLTLLSTMTRCDNDSNFATTMQFITSLHYTLGTTLFSTATLLLMKILFVFHALDDNLILFFMLLMVIPPVSRLILMIMMPHSLQMMILLRILLILKIILLLNLVFVGNLSIYTIADDIIFPLTLWFLIILLSHSC